MKMAEAQVVDLEVEIFYTDLDSSVIDRKVNNITTAMNELSKIYGQPRISGFLRYAYSPRQGWGYSRIPLFVVSEGYARELEGREFGIAEDFHGAAHELSHFWWSIADTDSPDDWINEGLAEFSAFRLSGLLFGKSFEDQLVSKYSLHAKESPKDLAIAETPGDSQARYVNRYEKTTLMFREAAKRFGQKNLDTLLRALYQRFSTNREATTELFLEEAEYHMGMEAKQFFSECLYEPGSPLLGK